MITKVFRRIVMGHITIVVTAVILNVVVSLKTQVYLGLDGQKNSDSWPWLETFVARVVLLEFILMLNHLLVVESGVLDCW